MTALDRATVALDAARAALDAYRRQSGPDHLMDRAAAAERRCLVARVEAAELDVRAEQYRSGRAC